MPLRPSPTRSPLTADRRGPTLAVAWLLTALVVALGLGATGLVVRDEQRTAAAHDAERLARAARDRGGAIADALRDDVGVLQSAAAFQSTNHHDGAGFQAYTARLPLASTPGLGYLSYIVPLHPAQVARFEAERRAAGQTGFAVDAGPADGRYHVIAFSGPNPGRTDGVDVGQVPMIGPALDQAADTGRPVVTDPFVRIQDRDLPEAEQQLAVGLYVPVYAPDAGTATIQQRREALLGWTASAVPVHSLLAQLGVTGPADVRLAVRDRSSGVEMAVVPATPAAGDARSSVALLEVLGQAWEIEVATLPSFEPTSSAALPIGIAGSLATGALAFLVLNLALQRRRFAITVREAVARIAATEGRFRTIVDNAPVGVVVVDEHGMALDFNREMARMVGASPTDRLDLVAHALPEDLRAWRADLRRVHRGEVEVASADRELRRADGSTFWARATAARLHEEGSVVALVQDVTAERAAAEAAEELRSRQARFEALVRNSNDLITVIGADRRVLYASPAVAAMVGVAPEQAIGTSILGPVHPDDRMTLVRAIDRVMEEPDWRGPVRYRVVLRDGTVRWIEASGTNLLDDPDVGGIVANCRDVTDQVEAAEALRRRAYTDPLTGLATRDVLIEHLAGALASATGDATVALLFVDLDRFKQVNDRFGHASGDALLVEVARLIADAVRPGDMVARHGGDEFVVLLDSVKGEREARAVADRVRSALRRPVVVDDGVVVEPGASVGVALSDRGATADAMLRDADAALYRAKAAGRDRVEVFDDELRRRAVRRLDTELVLRQALEDDSLSLLFEPVADLLDGSIVGAEARVRLALPSGDLVPYGELLPVAQEAGLASDLASHALVAACRAVKAWAASSSRIRWVGIDVSAGELTHPTFIARLAGMIDTTGVEPGMLRLELPVDVLMQGSSLTRTAIAAAKALGVGVVLDGVGAELRSLATLGGFEVDGLKLDLAALPDTVGDPVAAAVAASVGEVAAAAGLPVVVVGADHADQLEVVRRLGFRLVQGAAVGGDEIVERV
jgi:diguanylate cyclase (GGDEF)-like protein/PAS domain S-box-containing protein